MLLPAASMGRGSLAHLGTAVLDFARGALVAALALAFSYGLNAVHDRATDRSTAKNPLAGEVELFPGTMALMWASAAGALLAAMPGGVRPVGCTLLSLFAGAVYSAGPRLKGWPVIGTVLNVGIFLPLMWVAGPSDLRGVLLPITFSALLLQNQLWHEREDLDEDRAARVLTTASVLGDRWTSRAATAIGLLGGVAAVAMGAGLRGPTLAAIAACALGSVAPLMVRPDLRRRVHRRSALAGGALVYAAAIAAS